MIEFSYTLCPEDRFIVEIDGHADFAPDGADIVCAAASILALDLVDIAKRAEREGKTKALYSSTEKGKIAVDVSFKSAYAHEFAAALDTIGNGFALLEFNFPDRVICT